MKITSADEICWISLEPNEDQTGYSGFEMVAHVDIGHGQFQAKNRRVHFLNPDEFVTGFDLFVLDRSRAPRLEGTYDTYIGFKSSGRAVMCEYRVGDAFAGHETARFFQSGEFEVEQERLLEFLQGFQRLLASQ
jgi:hypothetical protein